MFMLDRKIISAALALSLISTFAMGDTKYKNGKATIDGGTYYPVKDGKTSVYRVNTQKKSNFKYGRKPTKNEIKAWDIDVMPDGTGLPEGKGSVVQGEELYEAQCVMCHGDFGSGGKGYPALAGGEHSSLKNQRDKPDSDGPTRVIGTYWPQASTLFWYIQSGMPFPNPKSLSDDETYALVAYLLSINEIEIDGVELDDDYVLDREKFLKIKMPNVDGFVPKIDGKNGLENVRKFNNDIKNFGNGKRCMKNCIEGKVNIVRIKTEMKDFHPPMSVKRDLPEVEKASGTVHPGMKIYEEACAVCHATDKMGAPDVGNKEAWADVLKKGRDKVYANGINGINGMPPKGGKMDLSDADFKQVVDYMIESSN